MTSFRKFLQVSTQILPNNPKTTFDVVIEMFPDEIIIIKISWPLTIVKFTSIQQALTAFSGHGIFSDTDPKIILAVITCIEELMKEIKKE